MQTGLRRRLCDRGGESLAETLVAVLIMSFGALMLAGMVQSSTRIVQTSNEGMTRVYQAENEAAEFSSSTSADSTTSDSTSVSSGYVSINGYTQIGSTKLGNANANIQIYSDDYSSIVSFRKK